MTKCGGVVWGLLWSQPADWEVVPLVWLNILEKDNSSLPQTSFQHRLAAVVKAGTAATCHCLISPRENTGQAYVAVRGRWDYFPPGPGCSPPHQSLADFERRRISGVHKSHHDDLRGFPATSRLLFR